MERYRQGDAVAHTGFYMAYLKRLPVFALLLLFSSCSTPQHEATTPLRGQWTLRQAQAWQQSHPWLVGCNFIPSTAINQLEMWQADTWDPTTIDRELGWAEALGFTSVRVFLHDLAFQEDPEGFLKRMEQFLDIADRHHIGALFVLFDGVWDPFPKAGKQREPRPHVHNSGWVQSPGADILGDPARQDTLKAYVQGVVGHFRSDRRVHAWDVFNEPDNPVPQYRQVELKDKKEMALLLLQKAYAWAREVHPSQPLTSGVWVGNWGDPARLTPMEHFQLEASDIISFHCYGKLDELKKCVEHLQRYGRPLLCTEYMARPVGSRFNPNLGYLHDVHVGAYNWGFVSGKTQTIYPWDSWEKTYTNQPPVWFHDILLPDGTSYLREETDYIKRVTGKQPATSPRSEWRGTGRGVKAAA